MRSPDRWRPSKILYSESLRRYVPNPASVSLGSRLAVLAMAEPYVRVIRSHARGRLLDCGCGDVPYYGLYRDLCSEVVCADGRASRHAMQHVDVELDLNRALPFDAGRFDTVLLADVLEHVGEPARLVGEIARVLSPGGKLLAMVPFLYWVHEAPDDYHRYTRFALEKLAVDASLTPLEISEYGGYPDVLLDVLSKGLGRVRGVGRAFVAAAALAMRTRRYARWRERTKAEFPLGYCVVAEKSGRQGRENGAGPAGDRAS